MDETLWEFWIDVGGTFTDCLARTPDGRVLRHKVLSSGVVKGCVGAGSTSIRILDPLRAEDPAGFWDGATLTILDGAGAAVESGRVERFERGKSALGLAGPLKRASPGGGYELSCGCEAPVLAVRYLMGLAAAEPVPPVRLRLGTTRGTNALLTRTGARTGLAVTRGFGDLLEIGYQDRPRLFDLTVRKAAPLAERVVEIDERVAADGTVLLAPDPTAIRRQLAELRATGVESLAICLLHADLYPKHERLVEQLAREAGFVEISRSSEAAPLVKIVARAETTVVDAYLNPVLREYLARLESALPGSQIRLMTSAGMLKRAGAFRGFESVLSGPAGGVVGFARAAEAVGRQRAIGFDMGGTSTDVARVDGEFEHDYESQKAGVRLVAPMLAIETVAAGGGSICTFDGVMLAVGPASAGADPGPACYGRGGPLCVTDLNLYLGRLSAERFPFRPDGEAVERRLNELADSIAAATGERLHPAALAEGLVRIANANMARAIHNVTVTKGFDPREYLLVAFGGAAGQHACAVARELGMKEILVHPDASVLSARGIGLADVGRHAAEGVGGTTVAEGRPGELQRTSPDTFEEIAKRLAEGLMPELLAEGFDASQVETKHTLDVRYRGADTTLNVPLVSGESWKNEFEQAHRRQFGYVHRGREIEVAAVRVEAVGRSVNVDAPGGVKGPPTGSRGQSALNRFTTVVIDGETVTAPTYDRELLAGGETVSGPAIIVEEHTATFVEPSWTAEMLVGGEILLRQVGSSDLPAAGHEAPAAVMLEVFNNLLAGIAERMGHMLRRTAMSVNVKERLDYSCAVFTVAGELAASAAHIPVHLGAMGTTVRAVMADNPNLRPGDVVVTNDPYRGGSHLPDVTVVLPVFGSACEDASNGTPRPIFFTACRAHHAEIGGVRPGSMPPKSRKLGEEGVVISNFLLVRDGEVREAVIRELLMQAPHPSRAVEENLADLRAQVAAVQQGAADLRDLTARYSASFVEAQMQAVMAAAESKVRHGLSRLPAGKRQFVDYLELPDGTSTPVAVCVDIAHNDQGPAAIIDFSGTGGVVDGNLNANPAIVSAAVLYVLRLLVNENIPLNEGALRAVKIVIPAGLLNPPRGPRLEDSPAVAAGNVETSQRVVDVLLGAFGLAAASQGTMNNLLFGDGSFGYYETICGGSGATDEGPGADAVQVHMTNTRCTDPEVLERRLPVRLWEFSVRRGSGGAGRHRGGDGAVRRMEFLAPLELSLITQRRGAHPPFALEGGAPGSLGENLLRGASGSVEVLAGTAECSVAPGDVLELRTPGGGGFGRGCRASG